MAGTLLTTSCADDVDYSVATGNIISSVTTGDAVPTAVSAQISGVVKDLSKMQSSSYTVGIVYSTDESTVTSQGTKKTGTLDENGNVTVLLTGLTKNVTYYYATYVTLQGKVTQYGEVKHFTTTDVNIETKEATNKTAVSATLNAHISQPATVINGADGAVVCGFKVFWTETDEDIQKDGYDYQVSSDAQDFSVDLKGLTPGQTYYYVPYYKISDGYQYGEVKSFTTEPQTMEWVDMGTNVLWAKWNLGATSETEEGGKYGWGDPTGTISSIYLADYNVDSDGKSIVGGFYDPATNAALNGRDLTNDQDSKLPTAKDFDELLLNTTQEWITQDGVEGCLFTSKVTGKKLFFPAVGYREATTLNGNKTLGDYWTGTYLSTNTDYGYSLSFSQENGAKTGFAKRSLALSIRPVKNK